MRIVIGVKDLLQKTRDGRTGQVLDGRAIERSTDAMYDLYRAHENEKHKFLA
jgi:hypothetical protein